MLDEFVHEPRVAYFSMEIELRSEIPTYARGLVNTHRRYRTLGHRPQFADGGGQPGKPRRLFPPGN